MESVAKTLPGCLEKFANQMGDRVALRQKELGIWNEISWSAYAKAVRATARALWEWACAPVTMGYLSRQSTRVALRRFSGSEFARAVSVFTKRTAGRRGLRPQPQSSKLIFAKIRNR